MSEPDLDRSVGFLIHDVARLMRKHVDRRALRIGLTRAQWSVLAHLRRNEGVNQATLADIMDVEPITLARHIDRLEAAGWVERQPDPKDRRTRRLALTDRARPLIERMRALAAEVKGQALAGFSEQEQELLVDMLIAVKRNLGEALSGDSPAEPDKKEFRHG